MVWHLLFSTVHQSKRRGIPMKLISCSYTCTYDHSRLQFSQERVKLSRPFHFFLDITLYSRPTPDQFMTESRFIADLLTLYPLYSRSYCRPSPVLSDQTAIYSRPKPDLFPMQSRSITDCPRRIPAQNTISNLKWSHLSSNDRIDQEEACISRFDQALPKSVAIKIKKIPYLKSGIG